MLKNNYRIGIIGGIGPMAGVLLQKLIIENTPIEKEQDHIQVICFTNPQIPDRTKSLQEDGGEKFIASIVDSIKVLEKTNINYIVIACNTAHACFNKIQSSTHIPILNMIDITFEEVNRIGAYNIGLLATDGTIKSKVFSSNRKIKIIKPNLKEQKEIMDIIYKIKSGEYKNSLIIDNINNLINKLKIRGAEFIILGCTELSLYLPFIEERNVIDPLDLLAKKVVKNSILN